MDTFVVVPLNEGCDVTFQLFREPVLLQLDQVLHGPVIPLDLSLRHGMIRLAPGMLDLLLIQVLLKLFRDIARSIVRKQSWPVTGSDGYPLSGIAQRC